MDLAALIAQARAEHQSYDHESDDDQDTALTALRTEMQRRRDNASSAGLLADIRRYGRLTADAIGEGEHGSPVEAELIEAQAELLLGQIADQLCPAVVPRSFASRAETPDASGRLPGCPCGLTGPVTAPTVSIIEPGCVHHGAGTAWAAGYAAAIARLRRDSEYRAWWTSIPVDALDHGYWGPTARGHLADYLEATGPDAQAVTRG